MADFIPLAVALRGTLANGVSSDANVAERAVVGPAQMSDDVAQTLASDVARARAAAYEAFERAGRRMLATLASEVLGRELAIDSADVASLARRLLDESLGDGPVAIAVAPCDASRLHLPLPVRIDATLSAGDIVLDVRDGAIESRFAVRRRDAIERALDEP